MKATLVLFFLAVLLCAPTASAETGAVVVSGTLKQRQRDLVAAAATQVLREASWSFVDPPLTDAERDAIAACTAISQPGPCVQGAIDGKTLDRVVAIDIRPDKTSGNRLALTVQIMTTTNRVPTTEGTHCTKQCTDRDLNIATTELVTLALKTAAVRSPSSGISISSVPEGAAIALDGEVVGTTPRHITRPPGTYSVLLQKDGYLPATKTVTVKQGEIEPIEVALSRAATTTGPARKDGVRPKDEPPPPPTPARSRVLPAITIGAGAALFVGGIVLSRSSDPPDSYEQPEYVRSNLGVGMSVVGGLAIAGGAVWLWRWWPRDTGRSSVPTISVTASSGQLGWATTF